VLDRLLRLIVYRERGSIMRQVGDTLIWLAMILVVAGVIYVMPRVASYVAAAESEHDRAAIIHGRVSSAFDGGSHFRR
jgi:hypothetical protein